MKFKNDGLGNSTNNNNLKEKATIFGSIFVLANRLQILGDRMDENVTLKQWLLIVGIMQFKSDAPTISEVANIIGNSRQNVKKMALILERLEFLTLMKDEKDGRIIRIKLTNKCLEYFKQREQKEKNFIEQLFAGFENQEIFNMNSHINKLHKNISIMEMENYETKE